MLVPKLRFKREDGTEYPKWETRQLHDVFVERNEIQTITEDAPLLSFTIEQGVINPEDKKTNKRDFLIKDKDKKKYALTEYNDVIYNPANLKFGAIHRNKLGRGVVSPIYAIFHTDENPVFMEYIVTNPVFIKKSLKYLEGTVIKLMTLKPRDFLLMKCHIPCLEEQQKIAGFLSTVDEVIAKSEAEVQNLEQQKKAAMQKIFSQEVRFKREDGAEYPDWEENPIGKYAKIFDGVHQTPNYIESGVPFVSVEDIESLENPTKHISAEDYERDFKTKPQKGDILMTRIGDVGRTAIVPSDGYAYYVSLALIKPFDNIDNAFLCQAMKSDFFQRELWEHTIHTAFPKKINAGDIQHCKISIPTDVEEQQKIAEFLSAYDEAIDYAKQELEHWKQFKKGLLQQMFV